jgi:hypothetical protein
LIRNNYENLRLLSFALTLLSALSFDDVQPQFAYRGIVVKGEQKSVVASRGTKGREAGSRRLMLEDVTVLTWNIW